jgi:AcrR family transcriptional regulator
MTTAPPMRKDAQRNREAILAAARKLFRANGPGVPVDDIAKEAGVGMGTLYRHFPTKDELIDAIVVVRFGEMAETARSANELEDPIEALRGLLDGIVALQIRDLGFRHALLGRARESDDVAAIREELLDTLRGIVARGQEAGRLRADLTEEDVLETMWATGRVVERTGEHAEERAARFLSLHLAGMQAADPA